MFSEDLPYWSMTYIIHIHIDKHMQRIFLKDYIRNWHWSLPLRSGIGSWSERKIYFYHAFQGFGFCLAICIHYLFQQLSTSGLSHCNLLVTNYQAQPFTLCILHLGDGALESPLGDSDVCFNWSTTGLFREQRNTKIQTTSPITS